MPPYYTIRNLFLNLLVSMAMFHVYEGENVPIFLQTVICRTMKNMMQLELIKQIHLVSSLLIDL